MVIFGSAFVLKFILLAALSDPAAGRLHRVMVVLLEGVTLGTLVQEPVHPATGYVAFATIALFLFALTLLPPAPWTRALMVTDAAVEQGIVELRRNSK
jgi:hypothetical protein